jgi:hypothetical protein
VFVMALECVAFAGGNPFRGSSGMVPGATSPTYMVGGRSRFGVRDVGLQVDLGVRHSVWRGAALARTLVAMRDSFYRLFWPGRMRTGGSRE